MKRVIMVHRWAGGPTDDWRAWLSDELKKLGYQVLMPEMPDRDTPVIEKWVSHLAHTVGEPDTETYFIGHSIGCQTILRYLETLTQPVGGAIFVAGWFNLENLEDEETEQVAKPWLTRPIDSDKIKNVLLKSTLLISDNDPYGAFETNKEKFSELGSQIMVIPGAGHFTTEDGYDTFPELLAEVKKSF